MSSPQHTSIWLNRLRVALTDLLEKVTEFINESKTGFPLLVVPPQEVTVASDLLYSLGLKYDATLLEASFGWLRDWSSGGPGFYEKLASMGKRTPEEKEKLLEESIAKWLPGQTEWTSYEDARRLTVRIVAPGLQKQIRHLLDTLTSQAANQEQSASTKVPDNGVSGNSSEPNSAKISAETPANPAGPSPRKRKSTTNGSAKEKIIAGLMAHHQLSNGSCGNFDPIGNNEFARTIHVSPSSVSDFIEIVFGGYERYRRACLDRVPLNIRLKLLNGDFSDLNTYGATPPGEGPKDND